MTFTMDLLVLKRLTFRDLSGVGKSPFTTFSRDSSGLKGLTSGLLSRAEEVLSFHLTFFLVLKEVLV